MKEGETEQWSAFQEYGEIRELKTQQDKLILFCKRLLMKEKYAQNPVLQWELLTFLMHIEHALFYMYKYASDKKVRSNKDIISLLNVMTKNYELYYEYYYKKDNNLLIETDKIKEEYLYKKCFAALEKSKGKETVIYSYIREILRLLQIGTSPIRSIILD